VCFCDSLIRGATLSSIDVSNEQDFQLAIPRFTRGMKYLSITVAVLWLVQALTYHLKPGSGSLGLFHWIALIPWRVIENYELWRLVTYPFVEEPNSVGFLGMILSFWWIGSPLERSQGMKSVVLLSLLAAVFCGAVAVLLGRLSVTLTNQPMIGFGAVTASYVTAWGMQYAEQPMSFFGAGSMKGKHLTLIIVGISIFMALVSRSLGAIASLGGLAVGAAWTYIRRKDTLIIKRDARGKPKFDVISGGKDNAKQVKNAGKDTWLN